MQCRRSTNNGNGEKRDGGERLRVPPMATLEACKGKFLVVFAVFLLSATRNVKICYSQSL